MFFFKDNPLLCILWFGPLTFFGKCDIFDNTSGSRMKKNCLLMDIIPPWPVGRDKFILKLSKMNTMLSFSSVCWVVDVHVPGMIISEPLFQ